jgi:hypothetical protein
VKHILGHETLGLLLGQRFFIEVVESYRSDDFYDVYQPIPQFILKGFHRSLEVSIQQVDIVKTFERNVYPFIARVQL